MDKQQRQSDEDLRQRHGFFFEACKHLTTLDTAAALVVLALNRNAGVYLWPLLFFGLSLVSCTIGMLYLALRGTGADALSPAKTGLVFGAVTFLAGLFTTFTGFVE